MDIAQKAIDSGADRVRTPAPEGLANRKLALLIMLSDMPDDRRHELDTVLLDMLLLDPDCTEWLDANPSALM